MRSFCCRQVVAEMAVRNVFRLIVFCSLYLQTGSFIIDKLVRVCYGDLGCFYNSGPFRDLRNRPLQSLPLLPELIGTTFTLYTRNTSRQEISADMDLVTSAFSPTRKTKFIVHGFLANSNEWLNRWMSEMKDAFLTLDDFNVIIVDWRRGALPPYTQATANTRVVGAQIAQLIRQLEAHTGASIADMHLIGHSLGAHICGYAGERIPGLGRISGLDPANPYFQNTHPAVRLDPTDAEFVDVIHTDADNFISGVLTTSGGFGTKQPSGHVDFYANGGMTQPGCTKPELEKRIWISGLTDFIKGPASYVICDHERVHDLYTASITTSNPRWFPAPPCTSYEEFKSGHCKTCGEVGCGKMGYFADTAKPNLDFREHAIYYLDTSAENPFWLHHYYLTVKVNDGQPEVHGKLSVKLYGENRNTVRYRGGREYNFVVGSSGESVTNVTAVHVLWQPTDGRNLSVDEIIVDLVANDLSEHSAVFHPPTPFSPGVVLNVEV